MKAMSCAIFVFGATSVLGVPPGQHTPVTTPAPVVQLGVVLDDGLAAVIQVPAGDRAAMTVAGTGGLSLLPYLHGDLVELVVEVLEDEEGAPRRSEVYRYWLERDVPERVTAGRASFLVVWNDLATPPPAAKGQRLKPCSRCCIVCDGSSFCACAVETTCGTCCCPAACSCPGTGVAALRTSLDRHGAT